MLGAILRLPENPMRGLLLLSLSLILCLVASYGLRYGLMEDQRWVTLCLDGGQQWQCAAREALGLLIHFRVLAWASLLCAALGWLLAGRSGRALAGLGMLLAVPALVLYSATLAAFALVIGGLRWVRAPTQG
jgi:hypothetical protein